MVLTTSTLNRVMVVELALPAVLPGLLVALHYGVQISLPGVVAPALGGRRTRWIVGGWRLSFGGAGGGGDRLDFDTSCCSGDWLRSLLCVLIGLGVGASGTSLLVLLATRAADSRRAAAATIVWVMMIAGFMVTAGVAGHLLDPFSPARLVVVAGAVSVAVLFLTLGWLGCRSDVDRPGSSATEGAAAPAFVPRRVYGRLVGAAVAPVCDLRLRLDAGLQRAGPDPGAVRRSVFGLTPGRRQSFPACSMAALSAWCWCR